MSKDSLGCDRNPIKSTQNTKKISLTSGRAQVQLRGDWKQGFHDPTGRFWWLFCAALSVKFIVPCRRLTFSMHHLSISLPERKGSSQQRLNNNKKWYCRRGACDQNRANQSCCQGNSCPDWLSWVMCPPIAYDWQPAAQTAKLKKRRRILQKRSVVTKRKMVFGREEGCWASEDRSLLLSSPGTQRTHLRKVDEVLLPLAR